MANKGVLIHLYYMELWDEIKNQIKKLKEPYHVYLNLVSSENHIHVEEDALKTFPNISIIKSENRGHDVGGYLNLIKFWISSGKDHDFLVFAHGKRSSISWRRNLFSSVFDFENKVLKMFDDQSIGMISSPDWIIHEHHGVNTNIIKTICQKLGVPVKDLHFVGGTMFWVRSNIYKELFSKVDIAEIIAMMQPGTNREPSMAHAFERIFGLIVENAGKSIAGLFDEEFYLTRYKDISDAVNAGKIPSGHHHYLNYGKKEGRTAFDDTEIARGFDEQFYLNNNPDVAKAVANRHFRSGYEHYLKFGRFESRTAIPKS